MIFGALLAGGVGSRMNIDSMPKQFLPLGTKPIFMHTLEKFCLCSEFNAIYIGTHRDWLDFVNDSLVKMPAPAMPIHVVCGGADRNGTILNIINDIESRYQVTEDDSIVTHDSVRPFVKFETIKANIKALEAYGACDTVIPATDTIVRSVDGETINGIPQRSEMYQGQTPQSFRIGCFKELFEKVGEAQRSSLTDACSILTTKGVPVRLVPGDVTNIKLTTVMDYKIAQAMLESGIEQA